MKVPLAPLNSRRLRRPGVDSPHASQDPVRHHRARTLGGYRPRRHRPLRLVHALPRCGRDRPVPLSRQAAQRAPRRIQGWLPRKVMHIDYFSPARLDDEITIVAYFSNIGRTSVTLNVDLLRSDRKTLIGAAYLVLVCVNSAMEKTTLPPEFRSLVDPYVMSTEEARSAL